MAITVNIGGIQKKVATPYVKIDGTWKTVNTVKNNINGVWRQSYPDAWTINIWRYGEIVNTLYCAKGQNITLVPTASQYSDDTFYGYSTAYNGVTIKYLGTATITPTSNLNLYAVYSFTASNTTMQQVTARGTAGQTLTVNNAVPETKYSVYESITNPYQQTSQSGSTVYYSVGSETNTTTKVDNATTTNNYITYTFSSFSSTTMTFNTGYWNSSTGTGYLTSTTAQTSWNGEISYWAYVTATGTKYRVVSHGSPSYINLYNYGSLIRTIEVTEGMSAVAGSAIGIFTSDVFYGWATSADSTTRVYASTANIFPHGTLNLYAIYSYTEQEEGTKTVLSRDSTTQTVTTGCTGTVNVTFTYYVSTPNGSVQGGYHSPYHYCKVGNTVLSGDYSGTVSSGTVIQYHGSYNSTQYTTETHTTQVQYPDIVSVVKYRVK